MSEGHASQVQGFHVTKLDPQYKIYIHCLILLMSIYSIECELAMATAKATILR